MATADAELASRVRRLRQYGWDDARNTLEVGVNSRLDPLQAAILHAKLPHLDADNARRAAIASRYDQGFCRIAAHCCPPRARRRPTPIISMSLRCDERDRLSAHLAADKIGSAVHYPVPVTNRHGYAERVSRNGRRLAGDHWTR